jgi:trans-aconitate methyltransferase
VTTDSDRAWKELARTRPYEAIVDHASRVEFFESGEQHVDAVMQLVHEHVDAGFQPNHALDFGCGVGRILIPLARLCDDVVGVDVSDDMLAEARRNCDEFGLENVELRSTLNGLGGGRQFDLVHTYIVLQHIPRRRGLETLSQLVDLVAPGGVGVAQIPYARDAPPLRKGANWTRVHMPGVNRVANQLQGRPANAPLMQMNVYSLDAVARVLHRAGCNNMHVRLGTTKTGGYLSALVVFRNDARDADAVD